MLAFVIRGLGALAAVAMSVVVARMLTVEEAGLFFFAVTLVTVLASLGSLGLHQSIVRFVAAFASDQNWGQVNAAYRFSIIMVGLASVALAVALWLAADWLAGLLNKPQLGVVLRSVAPAVAALSLFTLHARALQGLHEALRAIVVLNILLPAFLVIMLLVVGVNSASDAASLYWTAAAMTLIVSAHLWFRHRWTAVRNVRALPLWHSCISLWVAVIASQALTWSGQLVSAFFVGPQDMAFLAVAQRLSLLVSMVLIVVNMVLTSRYAALWHQGDIAGLQRLAQRATLLTGLLALAVVVPVLLWSGQVLWLFGEEYVQAAHLLRILLLGQLVNAATGSVSQLLMVSGHEKDIRNMTLGIGAASILMAFGLTSQFGVTGSAVAIAIALASQNFMSLWFVRKRLGFWTVSLWPSRH